MCVLCARTEGNLRFGGGDNRAVHSGNACYTAQRTAQCFLRFRCILVSKVYPAVIQRLYIFTHANAVNCVNKKKTHIVFVLLNFVFVIGFFLIYASNRKNNEKIIETRSADLWRNSNLRS